MKRNFVAKILVVLSLLLLVTTNIESVSAMPTKEEAPQVPTLLSPGNGSVASSNPPTLCAQASDPDGNLQGIKFEVNGGGEGDHISPFIQVDGNGTACWQDNSPWSEQDHAWQARAVDSAGNQSGASSQWGIKIPATAAPSQSETCVLNDLYADRSAPQTVGTIINFTVVATCTTGVNKIKTFVDGHEAGIIQGGSGSISWNTNGYNAGNHVFSVKVFGNSGGTAGRSHPYDLTRNNQEQQQTDPNATTIVTTQGFTQSIDGGEIQIIPNGPQGLNGDCPASPAVLVVGNRASIAGADLNLRPNPGVDNVPKTVIPNFALVDVVGGPKCEQEVRWFEVEYKDISGWAAEVGTGGKYHMYPVIEVIQANETPELHGDFDTVTMETEDDRICFNGSRFGMIYDGIEWHHYVEFDTGDVTQKHKWKITFSLIPSSTWDPPDESHTRVGFRWPSDWKVILFQPNWWKICSD